MTIYFIDFENVHEGGLKGLAELPEGDRVHLFYTVNANKISFDFFEIIRNSDIILHKVAAGKQALDMMLSSFLGFCVAGNPGARFVIVSKDRDYAPVVDFWNLQANPVDVEQYASIAAAGGETEAEAEPQEESAPSGGNRRRRGGRNRSGRGRGVNSRPATEHATEPAKPEESVEEEVPSEPDVTVPVTEPAEVPEIISVSTELFDEALEAVAEASAVPEESPEAEVAPVAEQTGEESSEVLELAPEVFEEALAAVAEAAAEPETKEAPKKNAERSGNKRNQRKEAPKKQSAKASAAETEKSVKPGKAEGADQAKKTETKETDKQRRGQEANAMHNAVQKALSKEKVDTNTIAFLASLTAKHYGERNDKQTIYRAVIKQYGQKEGLRLYGIMKTCFQ
ncbi:MAG: PIN domain-containing protein [Clostridia bacterium]|nr:PIN domain-containing protein [Clostridia bacterium]